MDRPSPNSDDLTVICAAFLAAALVAFVQLLTVSTIDNPQHIAIFLFAAAIPLLALGWYSARCYEPQEDRKTPVGLYGMALCITGIGACFWHFGWIAFAVFLTTTAYVLYDVLTRLRKDSADRARRERHEDSGPPKAA